MKLTDIEIINFKQNKQVSLENRIADLEDYIFNMADYFEEVLFPYLNGEIGLVEFKYKSSKIKEQIRRPIL